MTINDGQIFGAGIRILLTASNTVLEARAGTVAYLHFVDHQGNSIVPTYEPDGLQTHAGPLGGARYGLATAANVDLLVGRLDDLATRIAALEAVIEVTALQTKIKNPQGDVLFIAGYDGGPALSFFNGVPQPQVTLDPFTATTTDIAFELNAKRLTSPP